MNFISENKITLVPIAMRVPTKEFIYAPSRIRPIAETDQETFGSVVADTARAIPVSFEADGKSNPVQTTTYTAIVKYPNGKSMFGRYIIGE